MDYGWQLVAIAGPDAGRTFNLGAQVRVGRSTDSEVRLDDPQASRLHALIQDLRGDHVLTDQGSRSAAEAGLAFS